MKTVLELIKRAGGWHPGLYLKIDNAPYMELVIGALDESGPCGLPAISVAHYGEQNGGPMRDPEMCFELGIAGGAHLNCTPPIGSLKPWTCEAGRYEADLPKNGMGSHRGAKRVGPETTLKTPSGRMPRSNLPRARAVTGVKGEGLTTMVLGAICSSTERPWTAI